MGMCKKHGQYSTFCRECDMDTIAEHELNQKLNNEDHYKFIEKYGQLFASHLNMKHIVSMDKFSSGDGDKTRQYRHRWQEYGIPLCMGTMVYFLSKERLYCDDVRQTDHGWVPPEQWVISVVCNLPKVYEGEHYENIRKAYKAVIEQYRQDQLAGI